MKSNLAEDIHTYILQILQLVLNSETVFTPVVRVWGNPHLGLKIRGGVFMKSKIAEDVHTQIAGSAIGVKQ